MVHNIGIEEDHVENYFFDISTTQNHHPNYIKHVLGCILVFSPYLGSGFGAGRSRKGFLHILLTQLFTLGSSKIEVPEFVFVIW